MSSSPPPFLLCCFHLSDPHGPHATGICLKSERDAVCKVLLIGLFLNEAEGDEQGNITTSLTKSEGTGKQSFRNIPVWPLHLYQSFAHGGDHTWQRNSGPVVEFSLHPSSKKTIGCVLFGLLVGCHPIFLANQRFQENGCSIPLSSTPETALSAQPAVTRRLLKERITEAPALLVLMSGNVV